MGIQRTCLQRTCLQRSWISRTRIRIRTWVSWTWIPLCWGTSQHPLKLRLKMFEGALQYSICVFDLAWSKQHFLMYNVQHILVEFCLEQETFGWRYFPRLSET